MSRVLFKRYNFFISDSGEVASQQALSRSLAYKIPFVNIGVHPEVEPFYRSNQWNDTRRIHNVETLHVAIERNKNVEIPLENHYETLCLRKDMLEKVFRKLIFLQFKGLLIISAAEQCEQLYSLLMSDWYKQVQFSTLVSCSSVEDELRYVRPLAQAFPFDVQYLFWQRRLANRLWLNKQDASYLLTVQELFAEKHWKERLKYFTVPQTQIDTTGHLV